MAIKRGIIVILGLILQISLSLATYLFFIDHVFVINLFFKLIGLLLIFNLIRNSNNYSYTLPIIICLILFPVIGTLLYIILNRNKNNSKLLKNLKQSEIENRKYLVQNKKIQSEYKNNSKIRYLSDFSGYPVSKNNDVEYYPLGEIAFEAMLDELKKAEKFIFFEYFIVAHGKMWDSILEVLEQKVKEGLDVRVMILGVFLH